MRYAFMRTIAISAALMLLAPAVRADDRRTVSPDKDTRPALLQKVSFDQKLGAQLPLDLKFRDEYGNTITLGRFFGRKPVILSLVYYQCPMLCTQVLNGMVSSFLPLSFDVGKEFDVVTVSFDVRETPPMAAAKKETYLKRYGRAPAYQGWHFLTGDQASIDALTSAVGFHYAFDPQLNQFAHASGIMVITPEGKVAQYYYGIEYSTRDLRLGLIQASQNKLGTLVDQVLLYCYHYDPTKGRYGAIAMNIMRLGGAATVLLLGGFMIVMFRRDAHHNHAMRSS
ncbi:MAG: SCO family protein [Acidobacteriia bacterium]|nr:SCO family protein [Terriglobia bacterium]